MMTTGAGRRLRLALAAIWLIDAALQYQPWMFTRAFSQMLGESAQGNPPAIAGPVTWSAGIIAQHPAAANATFATIQLLLALGIAWHRSVKPALAVSIAWSLAVWWLGEGMGGVLTSTATPWNGAPGAVLIYALLAVLLWPASQDTPASFTAARPLGRLPARLIWLALWGSLAYFALRAATTAPQGLHDMVGPMATAQPDPTASPGHGAGALLAQHGQQASAVLALACEIIAVGVFLPAPAARAAVIIAFAAAAAIWVIGQNFGGILTGTATDPNTGPLLALLAAAYWPTRNTATATAQPVIAAGPAVTVP